MPSYPTGHRNREVPRLRPGKWVWRLLVQNGRGEKTGCTGHGRRGERHISGHPYQQHQPLLSRHQACDRRGFIIVPESGIEGKRQRGRSKHHRLYGGGSTRCLGGGHCRGGVRVRTRAHHLAWHLDLTWMNTYGQKKYILLLIYVPFQALMKDEFFFNEVLNDSSMFTGHTV